MVCGASLDVGLSATAAVVAGDLPNVPQDHKVALGFQTNPDGSHKLNFPRIQMRVDDETLDMLFDMGADRELNGATMACVRAGGVRNAPRALLRNRFSNGGKRRIRNGVCVRKRRSQRAQP